MPRDSAGVHSLPAGYLAVTGQTVQASQHNPPLEDLSDAITGSLPRNGSAGMQAHLPMGGYRITNMGTPSASTDAATKAYADSVMPIGAVIDFAGSTAPDGWLFCYGQAVSRSTYAALFSAIGTTYGSGNGSTTFNLPDARGRVVAGKDNMGGTSANRLTNQSGGLNGDTLGATGGSETHTLSVAQMPPHSHPGSSSGNTSVPGYSDIGGANTSGSGSRVGSSGGSFGSHSHSVTVASQGGGEAHNNVQPTLVLQKIIKAL